MSSLREALTAAMHVSELCCPYCGAPARMVTGLTVYPHRKDLHGFNFWRCDPCDAHVGCHRPNPKLGHDGTQPLGRLANAELRALKHQAHKLFDPIWKEGNIKRDAAYKWLALQMGMQGECHIGALDNAQCKRVIFILRKMNDAK